MGVRLEEKYWYGFVWHNGGKCKKYNPPKLPKIAIQNREYGGPYYDSAFLSSNHPGGVNCYFCDGHFRFLSEQIDYEVYAQLMTSRGERAALGGNADIDDSMY